MKKLLTIVALFLGISNYAQVNKADVEALLTQFPPSNYEYVYLGNIRVYYNNGSNSLEQKQYYGTKMNIEPKDNAIYLRFFKDETKAECIELQIVPYSQIVRIDAWKTGLLIDLLQ